MFQFHMHQFIDAATEFGITPIGDGRRPDFIQRVIRKASILFYQFIGKTLKWSRQRVLVTADGASLLYEAWPYCHCDIIPVLWDCWPNSYANLIKSLRLLDVKTAFFTQSAVAEKVREELGIDTCWIPEGVDIGVYSKGGLLSERRITLYELGRQMPNYHKEICKLVKDGCVSTFYANRYLENGDLMQLAFPTYEALLEALPQIQITVSFPKSLTHPDLSGGIETLTQRYWESMLTRSLIVGHCPGELITVLGYNPVIEVDWENPADQLRSIVSNISKYQSLVDKNYEQALSHASWSSRMNVIKAKFEK
jgi:hypothetical protein